MKRLFAITIAAIAVMVTLMLQGCNNDEASNPAIEAAQQAAEASQKAAEAAQQAAEALEATIPESIFDRESESTVGWGALSLTERNQVREIAKDHPFGGIIQPDHKVTGVDFILYLEDLPSTSQTKQQTLVRYNYESSQGSGMNSILVQGHFEDLQDINSIPDLFNAASCCFKYGGCIGEYQCNETLAPPKKCQPCKEKPCIPCQGTSRRTLDGAAPAPASNGSGNTLPQVDF